MAKGNNNRGEFEFRVIAGELKNRRITAPDLGVTRPPLTRVRKSIFDFLAPRLAGAAYLDLFSGTGSYLFEAVSRGAGKVVGVELEPKLVDSITRQAQKFGVDDRLECRCGDVFETVPQLARQGQLFDIVMIAPPQYKTLIDQTIACLGEHAIVRPGGIILCQYASSEKQINFGSFLISQERKYGNTTFAVLAPAS